MILGLHASSFRWGPFFSDHNASGSDILICPPLSASGSSLLLCHAVPCFISPVPSMPYCPVEAMLIQPVTILRQKLCLDRSYAHSVGLCRQLRGDSSIWTSRGVGHTWMTNTVSTVHYWLCRVRLCRVCPPYSVSLWTRGVVYMNELGVYLYGKPVVSLNQGSWQVRIERDAAWWVGLVNYGSMRLASYWDVWRVWVHEILKDGYVRWGMLGECDNMIM